MSNKKELINPPGTEKIYRVMKFSQAVRSGNMIWVSGQVGTDEKRKAASGVAEQARLAFTNLQNVLKAAGAEMQDIVELVTYHTSMEDVREFARVKDELIKTEYPAWTALGVQELIMPDLLLEIKATAVISSGTRDES